MNALVSNRVIAGSSADFMTARHLVLRGPQRAIGRALAAIALRDLGTRKLPWSDPAATRAQLAWLRDHWPAHYARSLGVAEALELPPEDFRVDPTFLYYDWAVPGCSNAFWPPAVTANGHALLSRNYDFTTGTVFELVSPPPGPLRVGQAALRGRETVSYRSETCVLRGRYGAALARDPAPPATDSGPRPAVSGRMGVPAPPEARAATAAPLLLETHPEDPDAGHATLSMTAYELLGGATDGVNDAGLGVSLMSTVDVMRAPGFAPTMRNSIGINEIQLVRFLLENAASAAEARALLARTPTYTKFVPCHFLVADASGDSFLWSAAGSTGAPVVRDGHPERPHCATNHVVGHAYAVVAQRAESTARLARLEAAVEGALSSGPAAPAAIDAAIRTVAATLPPGQGQYPSASPARTLWQASYDLTERALAIDFYLGDAPDGTIRRSPRRGFTLAT